MFLRDFVEKKHRIFTAIQMLGICVALAFSVLAWFFGWYPHPGISVAVLAVLAAAMSIQPEMKGSHKAAWMLLFGAFLAIEFLAISQEAKQESTARDAENGQFDSIARGLQQSIMQSGYQFKETMQAYSSAESARQKQFEATTNQFDQINGGEQRRFDALIDHEEKLAESLNGTLVPGNEPTPANNCPDEEIPPKSVRVFIGDAKVQNVNVVDRFPSVVLARARPGTAPHIPGIAREEVLLGGSPSNSVPVVTLDRAVGGEVTVTLDMRYSDGKIIARMDQNGFVVNRNAILEVKKEKSRLQIFDEYGDEVLDIQYFNPQAIGVSGKGIGLGQTMTRFCAMRAGPFVLPQQTQ